ncbi:MAG: response regulator transcription factor, partial [Dehalococcoidia bacterium]
MIDDSAAGLRARVLVVDDEHTILAVVRDALECEGYSVDTAVSGEEALETAERQRPDLIVLDVNLPDLDGWEVLSRLRATAGPQTPVVVMTAGFAAQDQALASGAQGYLGKPFGLQDLLIAVESRAHLPMEGARETVRRFAR